MVLYLNFLVPIVILGISYISLRTRHWQYLLVIPFFMFVYWKVQPSYLPKGDIARTPVPEFTVDENAVIVDNAKTQPTFEQRVSEQEQKYKDGLSFIEK